MVRTGLGVDFTLRKTVIVLEAEAANVHSSAVFSLLGLTIVALATVPVKANVPALELVVQLPLVTLLLFVVWLRRFVRIAMRLVVPRGRFADAGVAHY
jgi:hypothetical protein